jgi:hypothetical protein
MTSKMLGSKPMEDVVFTQHAKTQMARRGITESLVQEVLFRQEEIIDLRPGRIVIQGTTRMGDPPRDYLLRVFVDTDREPPEVVTVYRTSKIDKYRSRI